MSIRNHLATAVAASLFIGCSAPGGGTATPATDTPKERTVALRGGNGQYVSCDLTDGALRERLVCRSPFIGEWEKFTLVDLGGGHVALRAKNTKYVAAELDLGNYLAANRDKVGPFETFELVTLENGDRTLKAHNGRYVGPVFSLPADSAGMLFASSMDAGADQRFTLVEDPKY